MKPELIVQDFAGAHNGDLSKTRARLIKGATWKKQRVALILPSADLIPAKVALCHWNLIFPPNQGVVRILALGQEVGEAYSNAIQGVLDHPDLQDWEYVLTLEHDNSPPQDGLLRLIEQLENHPEFAAISGSYFTKGEGGVWQGWGDPSDPVLNFRPQIPRPGELQEVCGLGMGFCLFRLAMFKDASIRRPWFKTLAGPNGVGTQDLQFWAEARKHGYRCAVDVSCTVGHYDLEGKFGPPDTMW